MQKKLKWTETCFSSCYCSCNLFQARLTENKFWPASAFTLFSDPPPSALQKFKFLASSIVHVSVVVYQMWCCQCVSSQLDTHIAEVLAGVTLSVNAFECLHARGPSRLARLDKDLTCAPASQAYVECIFCLWADLFWTTMFRCLEMSVCIKLRQCWKKRLACAVTVFQRLGVNVTDLM